MNLWMSGPKRLFLLLLALAALSFSLLTKETVLFFPYEIPASLPFRPEWELSSLSPSEQDHIFSQPFSYLGKGHQCIAFESQDQRYVLKFPYHTHRLPHALIHNLPFFKNRYEQKLTRSIQKKLSKDAEPLRLAFTRLKEETGLVAIHWNRTSTLGRTITITDDANQTYLINLDHAAFAVQKKAELLYPCLERWMNSGEAHLAKEGLSRLVAFLHERPSKGLEDPEAILEGNFGFIGTAPVQIDTGHLRQRVHPCNPEVDNEKIWQLLLPLKKQLDASYPDLGAYLEEILSDCSLTNS